MPERALMAVGLGARRMRAARSSDSRSSSAAANARRTSPSEATALPAWRAGVESTTSEPAGAAEAELCAQPAGGVAQRACPFQRFERGGEAGVGAQLAGLDLVE